MRRSLGALLAALVVASACAADGGASDAKVVQLVMTEFAFAPSPLVLGAGDRVALKLVNRGSVVHELMAGTGAIQHDGGYTDDLFAGVDMTIRGDVGPAHSHGAFGVNVKAKGTVTLTFTVPDRTGTYEIGCFEPGHYLAGMVGKIVIE
ncbi:MAG: hypothetical protein AAB284_06730 [Chloroflexota bacterium]